MRTRFTALVVVAMVLALPGASASATAPFNVTGSFDTESAIDDVVWHGDSGNRSLYWHATMAFEGDLVGSLETYAVSHVNHNGEFAVNGFAWFNGCIDNLCGTLHLRIQGTGGPPNAQWAAHTVVLDGTGDLANMRGQGTMEGATGVGGTYSMNLHMDPAP